MHASVMLAPHPNAKWMRQSSDASVLNGGHFEILFEIMIILNFFKKIMIILKKILYNSRKFNLVLKHEI